MVSSTPRPHFTPGKDPVPIVQDDGWAPGPVWTGGKSRPHRESIPDRPARIRHYTDRGTGPTNSACSTNKGTVLYNFCMQYFTQLLHVSAVLSRHRQGAGTTTYGCLPWPILLPYVLIKCWCQLPEDGEITAPKHVACMLQKSNKMQQ